jgi:hypothetical protein
VAKLGSSAKVEVARTRERREGRCREGGSCVAVAVKEVVVTRVQSSQIGT